MSIVDLDRRFLRWNEKENDAAEIYAVLRHYARNDLDWPKLLQHHRVVVLAEAGSGKTEELREQAQRLVAIGQFGFYATVQDVGREGLESAIGSASRGRLEQWRGSDQPAWFFIDSIDEAKFDKVHLDTALRKLADTFEAAPRRAHLVLSGRLTDWEFRADLSRVAQYLPVPPEPKALSAPTPDALLVQVLRGERHEKSDEKVTAPLVVLMAPLDVERVRRFAAAKGVTALDPFMAAIEDANLWPLARHHWIWNG